MSQRTPRAKLSVGVADIPRWVGLAALIALVYATSQLPSELRPLPIVTTLPESGEFDVPTDTAIQVLLEPGGVLQTFGDVAPEIHLSYESEPDAAAGPVVKVQVAGDTVRGIPAEALEPGRKVRVAVSTRYERNIVWYFETATDPNALLATPLPPLE